MVFWILIVLMVGCIVWWLLSDGWSEAPVFTTILVAVFLTISLGIFACEHLGAKGDVAQYTVRYENLVYQYENNIYENDNDLGKRDLITDIQAWNEALAWHKSMQNDFWIGIYIPDIYDQFKYIELK